jgi:cytoskeletal protein RodZ
VRKVALDWDKATDEWIGEEKEEKNKKRRKIKERRIEKGNRKLKKEKERKRKGIMDISLFIHVTQLGKAALSNVFLKWFQRIYPTSTTTAGATTASGPPPKLCQTHPKLFRIWTHIKK